METGMETGAGEEIDSRMDIDIDGETREVDNNSDKIAPEALQRTLIMLEQQNKRRLEAARKHLEGLRKP